MSDRQKNLIHEYISIQKQADRRLNRSNDNRQNENRTFIGDDGFQFVDHPIKDDC
jgi:hypothetical protein